METSIWKSRKLWVGIVDALVSVITMTLTIYLSPDNAKFALGILAALQPVVYLIIAGLTAEEVAKINAEATKESARLMAKVK